MKKLSYNNMKTIKEIAWPKDLSSAVKEKDQRLSVPQKEIELNKVLLLKEKDNIEEAKQDM